MRPAFLTALAAAFLIGLAPPAFAQRDWTQQKAEYLNGGARGYSARSAGSRLYDARQYTERLHDYVQAAPAAQASAPVTKTEAEHIGQTIQAAKQNLEVVKAEAAKTGDKVVLKKLEAIDKHLAQALEHHKSLHMECCKDRADAPATAECCDELMTELDKAIAEHALLLRLLEGTPVPSDAAAPAKKQPPPARRITTTAIGMEFGAVDMGERPLPVDRLSLFPNGARC